ncbi:D-glycero-beta-D-manno-heptose-7-phosphate kinase [Candidatus Woesebacteria bacterium]|nr:D-glycero-beta-D-manno-heptose-7-phosphate kinase [Candidatus Woesebacteria bacterium]
MSYLQKIIQSFRGRKVLVVGDVMIDQYSYGVVDRISPEAPVPIVHLVEEKFVAGGAGNVYQNLLELGAEVSLVSVSGDDISAEKVASLFNDNRSDKKFIVRDSGRKTTVKQRLVAGGQQMLRFDSEDTHDISQDIEAELLSILEKKIADADVVCVSDYAKGVITKKIASRICQLAAEKKVPVVVDTKPKHFSYFHAVSVLAPNESEVLEFDKKLDVVTAAKNLAMQTTSDVLVTRGSLGMLAVSNSQVLFSIPSFANDVRDVSGAGDTVVSLLALGFAAGLSLEDAAFVANHGAAIAVSKPQTSAVSIEELIDVLL